MPEDDEIADEWLAACSDIIGATTGSFGGFYFGGPVGGAAGGAMGAALAHGLRALGREVWSRYLSPREKKRIASVLWLTAKEIQKRCEAGERIREDGFFNRMDPNRSPYEEVAEGVLIAAQREPEEKKLDYLGNLLGGIAFDESINVGMAHQINSLAGSLSYRQISILALASNPSPFDLYDQVIEGIDESQITAELASIAWDCFDLRQKGLLSTGTNLDLGIYEIRPASLRLQMLGRLLHDKMGLLSIPKADIEAVAEPLSFGRGPIPGK
jgi:hypothetical protein